MYCARIGEQAARQCLHCDKTHTAAYALFDQLCIVFGREIAERKLQRIEIAAVDGFVCEFQRMLGKAYKAYLALLFGL